MPDENTDANSVDSSTTQPATPNQEGGSAADPAVSASTQDSQAPETAVADAKDSSAEDSEALSSKAAIELLSGKKVDKEKPEQKSEEKKPAPPKKPVDKPAPKDDKKAEDDPLHDYSDEEKRRISHKTRDRVEKLWRERKEFEAKLKETEPLVVEGKVWNGIVNRYQLRNDLAEFTTERDEQAVAEAIKFQAAINRASTGRATQNDAQFLATVFDTMEQTREAFGLGKPQQTPDYKDLEAAIAKAKSDFDFDALEKALGKLKEGVKPQEPARPAVQPQAPSQPPAQQQTAPGPSPDELYYGNKAKSDLLSNGISEKDLPDYVGKTLWPKVLQSLSAAYPGQNAAQIYQHLSPQVQYDALLTAHREIQKQQAASQPAPKPAPANPRPVRTQGTAKMQASEMPLSSGLAAARYLATGTAP